jgi:L-cysteine desulfidase
MTILKEVLRHEVLKTLGCTEPSAVALACSTASQAIFSKFKGSNALDRIRSINVVVNQGVLKNGIGVCVANAKGEKGNAIAAALGAICGNPNFGPEVLRDVNQIFLDQAKEKDNLFIP